MKILKNYVGRLLNSLKLVIYEKFYKYASAVEILLSLVLLILLSTFIYIIKLISEAPFYTEYKVQDIRVESQELSVSSKKRKNILIITSYHVGYSWSDNEITGLIKVLQKYSGEIEYYIEFLDTKRWPTMPYAKEMISFLKSKYANMLFDLIIVLDNPALEFVLDYNEEFFKDIPIVFGGINGFTMKMLRGRSKVFGVTEIFDIEPIIEFAHNIIPNLDEIYVLHDYSTTGLLSRQNIATQLIKYSNYLKITFFENLPISEIISRLQLLSSSSIVLAISYSIDKNGKVFDHPTISRILGNYSPVPVFVVHAERVGHGVLGGYVLEGKTHGQLVAEIAIKNLFEQDTSQIYYQPFIKPNCIWMFDYNVLKKFKISENVLPANSVIVNKPISLLDIYPEFSLKAWIVFLTTLSCLVALILFILIKNHYEKRIIISEHIFRSLFNSLKDMVLVISKDGDILRINKAVEKCLEYKEDEILHTKLELYLQNNTKSSIYNIINETNWNTKDFIIPVERFSFKTKSKSDIPVELMLSQITLDNEVAILISARDLRPKLDAEKYRKKFEEELINTQKIEIINFISSEVSYNLSDFLTKIIGYAELALELLQRNVDIQKYLVRIKEISLNANTIFKNLLYFCRKPSEDIISLIDINTTIEKLISIFTSMFYNNIEFNFIKNNEKILTNIAQNHLEQILANIILNSIDAMPNGGKITIISSLETYSVDLDIKTTNRIIQAGEYIVVTIEDTGFGIPKEIESKIFEPFFTTKCSQYHAGLGLTIAINLVHMYNGAIDFSSEHNKGTKFIVYLPKSSA